MKEINITYPVIIALNVVLEILEKLNKTQLDL